MTSRSEREPRSPAAQAAGFLHGKPCAETTESIVKGKLIAMSIRHFMLVK